MKIQCKICGKEFDFLPPHLRKTHGVSVDAYRDAYQIPAGVALCSESYSQAHAEKIRRLQKTGVLTYDHLPDAVAAASASGRGNITDDTRAARSERIAQARPWTVNQLPTGAKRADGRDADRARESQRERRKKHRETK